LLQDRNVGVGILPERKEILISSAGFHVVALQRVGASEAKMRKCTSGAVLDKAPVVQDFLELRACLVVFSSS